MTNKLTKYHIVFRRKHEKDILAGDGYIIEATTERAARKEVRQLLKSSFFNFDIPKIAWVNIINDDGTEEFCS